MELEIYTDFAGITVIVDKSNLWTILDFNTSQTIATATGTASYPPFDLTWTPEPGYSNVQIVQGYCP